MFDFCKWTA